MMLICGCWLDTRHAFPNQLVWAKSVLNQLSRKHLKHSTHPWNLKSHSFYKSVELQKNITKSSPRMWKLSVCLSELLAHVAIFACVKFLMNYHVTCQVTWLPRNLQRAFDPTGALCPTLPYVYCWNKNIMWWWWWCWWWWWRQWWLWWRWWW